MKTYKIEKKTSSAMKGIAIMMMLFHHLLTFDKWINYGRYTPKNYLLILNSSTKLCVAIFAFISGWAIYINKSSITKVFKKVFKFYLSYWILLIFSLLIILIFTKYKLNIVDIIKEFLGIGNFVMIFCWYVPFYAISILLMCLLNKIKTHKLYMDSLIYIIFPIILFYIISNFFSSFPNVELFIRNFMHWFPCIGAGYVCNKYNLFSFFEKITNRINYILFLIISLLFCFIGRYYISGFDFLYCVILVFSMDNFFKKSQLSFIILLLDKIGTQSTNIWYLHCLIFCEATQFLFQPVIYIFNCSLLVYIIAFILLYFVAILFTKLDILLFERI